MTIYANGSQTVTSNVIYAPLFIVALFTVTKNWKQLEYLRTDD